MEKEQIDNDLIKLECMLGCSILNKSNAQVGIFANLPTEFPAKLIHYEFYEKHIELHIEPKNSNYKSLCSFLHNHLPNNDIAVEVERNFCEYAYMLKRNIEGWSNLVELGNAIIEMRNIVEPVLWEYCEQVAYNFELAKELGDYYKKQEALLPYHINVIDELHANENAHSRILTQLLKYKESGKLIFLSSFLKLLPNFTLESLDIHDSKVLFNSENIDVLIVKDYKYAVIIENKIHWAVDQDKQIERYVTTKHNQGIPADNIWVIYLTRDGRKKVENYSFTDETKKIVGNRFIEMDYLHDILPWLKETILPNCRLKEEWLETAIKQYIDHLEGLFDIRESQIKLLKKVQSRISNSIGCSEGLSKYEIYLRLNSYMQMLSDLQNIVGNYTESLTKPIVEHVQRGTIELLESLCPNEDISFNNRIHDDYLQIFINKWNEQWNQYVHFEWNPLNEEILLSKTNYTLELHVEKNNIIEHFKNVICNFDSSILQFDVHDNRTFYKKEISTKKPLASMSHEELMVFLKDAYEDIDAIVQFVEMNILPVKD